jgi:hypothetical protein
MRQRGRSERANWLSVHPVSHVTASLRPAAYGPMPQEVDRTMLRNALSLATATRMGIGGRSIPILTTVLALGVACVTAPDERMDRAPGTGSSRRSDAAMSADAELSLLGNLWFETPPVTITYRTTDRPPGEPTSAHQCLRQMKGFDTDRQELLAICNRSGTVALAWNPPERWRMDLVTAEDAFAVVASPSASFRCRAHAGPERCIRLSPNGAAAETAFAPLVTEPGRILERIGVSEGGAVIRSGTRTIARSSATCFSATGRSQVSEVWCFSDEGLLLFASTSTPDGTRMTAEATRVSPGISEPAFQAPE